MTSPFQTGAAPLEGAGPEDVTVSNRVNYLDPRGPARRGAARRDSCAVECSQIVASTAPRRAAPRRVAVRRIVNQALVTSHNISKSLEEVTEVTPSSLRKFSISPNCYKI